MRSTDDFSDISSMDNLYSYSKSRTSPVQAGAMKVLGKETNHPLGVAAKFIAGAMAGRGGNDQAASIEQRMRLVNILQKHEQDGLPDDDTFKELLTEYARTGNPLALNIATKLKPSVRQNPDAVEKLAKLSKARLDHLESSGKLYAGEEELAAFSQKDPTLKFIDDQIAEITGQRVSAALPQVNGGMSEKMQKDPDNFAALGGANIDVLSGPGGAQPKMLSPEQLAEQNKKALAARGGGNKGGGGRVRLQAPDGSIREVPAESVEKYLKKGAKRV